MNKMRKPSKHLVSCSINDASFWWFLESDEFDWYFIENNVTEQVIWVTQVEASRNYEILVFDGNCIKTRVCQENYKLWRVEEIEQI